MPVLVPDAQIASALRADPVGCARRVTAEHLGVAAARAPRLGAIGGHRSCAPLFSWAGIISRPRIGPRDTSRGPKVPVSRVHPGRLWTFPSVLFSHSGIHRSFRCCSCEGVRSDLPRMNWLKRSEESELLRLARTHVCIAGSFAGDAIARSVVCLQGGHGRPDVDCGGLLTNEGRGER